MEFCRICADNLQDCIHLPCALFVYSVTLTTNRLLYQLLFIVLMINIGLNPYNMPSFHITGDIAEKYVVQHTWNGYRLTSPYPLMIKSSMDLSL